MKKNQFITLLEDMLEVDTGSLNGDENLDDLPWDSLSIVSFIALADEHLNIMVDPQALSEAKSLSEVLVLINLD